ncbi:MAG: peptidoglycan DD-metalloendopeptidase family protein [Thermodesulfobacteriota bacterium]
MGRGHRVLHAAALAACFLGVARPDRLWSSLPPRLTPEAADALRASLSEPWTPSIDERFGVLLEERIRELRGFRRAEGEVASGETLGAVLQKSGVAPADALALARSLAPVFDPRRARPGDAYTLLLDPQGRPAELTYRRSPVEVYRAEARGEGWRAEKVEIPVAREEAVLAGSVRGSLYASFLAAGADPDLVMAFVDLFAWDLDFSRDTREGDAFEALYETLSAGGEPVGNGRLLAARYRGARGTWSAVYYRSAAVEGYFDPEGRSVRKSFLRSPLQFSRISSRFTHARRHPVLDVVRPHQGVDYAAPAGTPVWAVADGTVEHAGWKGEAGNTVALRHARGYETLYNHLSGFGRGIRAGARVAQGQVIGYVGQTGLATGPHLDFRVKKDGRWVDPLREKYVPGDPVPRGEADAYRAWARGWLDRLDEVAAREPERRVARASGGQ